MFRSNVLAHWTEKISQTCKPVNADITQYAPSEEWDCEMFTRHHSLCTEGSYFLLPGEINYFHQQLVSLVKQKRNWNDNPLDNGLFNPLGLVIVIASLVSGANSTMCVCLCILGLCVCVWVNTRLCLLWALQGDFPVRVRFTAGFLQDESGCLIEWPPSLRANEHQV